MVPSNLSVISNSKIIPFSNIVTVSTKQSLKPTPAETWIYGLSIVTFINCCSLFGACVIPFMNRPIYSQILMFMVALAVGSLTGSGLLFLIPDALRFNEIEELAHTYPWILSVTVAAIYCFFLVERFLKITVILKEDKKSGASSSLDCNDSQQRDRRTRHFSTCSDPDVITWGRHHVPEENIFNLDSHRARILPQSCCYHPTDTCTGAKASCFRKFIKSRSISLKNVDCGSGDANNQGERCNHGVPSSVITSSHQQKDVKNVASQRIILSNIDDIDDTTKFVDKDVYSPKLPEIKFSSDTHKRQKDCPIECRDCDSCKLRILKIKENDNDVPHATHNSYNAAENGSSVSDTNLVESEILTEILISSSPTHDDNTAKSQEDEKLQTCIASPSLCEIKTCSKDRRKITPKQNRLALLCARVAPMAWMIVTADSLHNFIDGLSIGAAFSESVILGISVSIAIFCEELPHELGDFAILLQSGMTIREALGVNFLSACACYVGLVIGILLGELSSSSTYIFAIGGGMFIYIGLVDMLPEVNKAAEEIGNTCNLRRIILVLLIQNSGILVGYGAMLFMSVYAETIQESIFHKLSG